MTPIDTNGVPTGPTYEARLSCPVCGLDTYQGHWTGKHKVCVNGHPLVDYGVPCYVCAPELAPGPSAGKGWRV
jgi:hypothetical protein